ncbi:transcription factor IIA alpha/beta subunit [Desarmillaria ectypa]|nr:transcription factor IIA alpha/beta subunit [Desarmillaria ectypa]
MSNKIVPNVYRAVIDDVIDAIKPEFEEYGVPEDVLAELQRKWEDKVIASHVAEFESGHQPPQQQVQQQQQPHYNVQHPMHIVQGHPHYAAAPYGSVSSVKTEPVDASRYILAGPPAYAIPPLPGPSLSGLRAGLGGQTSILSFPPGPPPIQPANGTSSSGQPAAASTTPRKIPQVDGPSDDSDDSASPPPFAPRSQHPSLPQPQSQSSTSAPNESEAINSDLDDSDTEAEDDAEDGNVGDTDIVFCTYDKVARVKNKWKCILKDGMIHINGKDYLFQKCTGEFEW